MSQSIRDLVSGRVARMDRYPTVLIVGKHGSGKTTLVRHLLRALAPGIVLPQQELSDEALRDTTVKKAFVLEDIDAASPHLDALQEFAVNGRFYACATVVTCQPRGVRELKPNIRTNMDYVVFLSPPDERDLNLLDINKSDLPAIDYAPGVGLEVDMTKLPQVGVEFKFSAEV